MFRRSMSGRRKRHVALAALGPAGLVAMLLLPVQPAGGQEVNRYLVDTGPLRIRDQFLLGMGFLAFDPVSADVLGPGEWQVDLILTVANDFAHSQGVERELEGRSERAPLTLAQLRDIEARKESEGIFLVDGEHRRTAVAVRRGLGKGVQIELLVPVIGLQGGVLDSTVERFHDLFSFEQAGRLGAPKDSFVVYARSRDTELFVDKDPGAALGDIVVGAKFDLRPGADSRRSPLALEALVKLPTGDEESFTSSGSADVGAQLLATKYFTRSCIHGSAGVLYLGDSESLDLGAQTVVSGMLAFERAVGTRTSVVAQATLSQSPFGDLDLEKLDQVTTQVTLGLKRVLGRRVLFVGLTENVANFGNSPDIGVHVGLTTTFGKRRG